MALHIEDYYVGSKKVGPSTFAWLNSISFHLLIDNLVVKTSEAVS